MCNCIATESDTYKILFQLRQGGDVGCAARTRNEKGRINYFKKRGRIRNKREAQKGATSND